MQQIVVMKGNCGFGDRLQVLSHCINYCKTQNARLCVDWRDRMWGQKDHDFSDYFDIIDVPVISIEEVVKQMRSGSTVNPVVWTPELMLAIPDEARELKYNLAVTDLQNITTRIDGDIIVFNNQGFRKCSNLTIVNNIKIKDTVCEEIKQRLIKMSLPCCIIHLRGTDQLDENFTREDAIRHIDAIYQLLPKHCKSRCYVITDMILLLTKWLNEHPECVVLQDTSPTRELSRENPIEQRGIHMYNKEILQFYNISKHELNLECIADFIALSFADNASGNSKSCFFSMARFINKRGNYDISNWLNGWKPPIKEL